MQSLGLARIKMKPVLTVGTTTLFAACLTWRSVAGTADTEPPAPVIQIAKPAPAFALKDTTGKDVKLADFEGKALIVFFWATWDKPSQKQLTDLVDIQRLYEKQGFTVIGISLDNQGPTAVKAYTDSNHIKFPVLMADATVVQGFGGLDAIPTLFVIEPHHNVISRHVGVTGKSVLENELKAIFKQVPK
jgi:peroxiredoxin